MCASFIKEDARYNIDIIILAQPDFQHVECAECGRDVCGRETVTDFDDINYTPLFGSNN